MSWTHFPNTWTDCTGAILISFKFFLQVLSSIEVGQEEGWKLVAGDGGSKSASLRLDRTSESRT